MFESVANMWKCLLEYNPCEVCMQKPRYKVMYELIREIIN
jgi:hypothetical protein